MRERVDGGGGRGAEGGGKGGGKELRSRGGILH